MLISDMIPYERNAWDNQRGVPAIARSIADYGFRGQIKLWRRDNPVIVSGHHRVAACKLLGWAELPDEHVCWCEDMSEEDVKAFRLADNRTGEGGTWKKALLKSEVASLGGKVDMSRYGFDFKSKALPHGAERLKTDRAYNLDRVSRGDCNGRGFPALKGRMAKPAGMTGFNYAKSMKEEGKRGQACHFFVDDYQFERVWANPERYVDALRGFDCVLTPDFSLYMDMPAPMQAWNRYRSQAVGLIWQRAGLKVVPTLSWAGPDSYGFCFEGVPKRSTVAVSTVGVKGDETALAVWHAGMTEAMESIRPRRVLLYGGDVGFDFGPCEVVRYRNNVTERMANRGR